MANVIFRSSPLTKPGPEPRLKTPGPVLSLSTCYPAPCRFNFHFGFAFAFALAFPFALALAFALCAGLLLLPSQARAEVQNGAPTYAQHPEALAFVAQLAEREQLSAAQSAKLLETLGQAHFLKRVPPLMLPAPSGTAKNWALYRSRFIEPKRIQAGVKFWRQNQATLNRAQARYGVPPEIVVGILGVETLYGEQMGRFRVLDALATLAFDFPAEHPRAAERQAYFQKELAQFLLHQMPAQRLGSYAGATGLPQFMPSSIVQWAVDFDGDGRLDLDNVKKPADAIGSVAHYFQAFGWKAGQPTHWAVQIDKDRWQQPENEDKATLLAPDILPSFSAEQMASHGVNVKRPQTSDPKDRLALVELQNGSDEPSYVVGTENFYVITRYNWSSYYAMAVIELGEAVAKAKLKKAP
jgi:membrane-bound lytic murein transglycosylase B